MSEKIEAKRDGAKQQKNSGRGDIEKADAILDDLSIDYKESEKTFSLSMAVWGKACTDAAHNGVDYNPCIKLILGESNNKVRLGVLEWSYIQYLKECERKLFEMGG